jgi:hypothetical protein
LPVRYLTLTTAINIGGYANVVDYISVLFRFKHILKPIADACIREEQKEFVDFEPYYTHIVCHECCHGIGPHSITLPSGKKSTVRLVCTQTGI